MAAPIHLELLTDFFNKIGPFRHSRLVRDLIALGATSDIDPHKSRMAR